MVWATIGMMPSILKALELSSELQARDTGKLARPVHSNRVSPKEYAPLLVLHGQGTPAGQGCIPTPLHHCVFVPGMSLAQGRQGGRGSFDSEPVPSPPFPRAHASHFPK